MENYDIFKYYKGEVKCPFAEIEQRDASHFWHYESIFDEMWQKNDFSVDFWVKPNKSDKLEWIKILSQKPVNKQELFKLWLYYLLMEYLPEKYESHDTTHFLNLYWETISMPV